MWDKLKLVHGGDKNVLRAKAEILRGKFDDLKMKEGENITQYNTRIKEVVNAIRGVGGVLEEDKVVSKILRTLLPTYAIRVSTIQEMRAVANSNVTLGSLIG